MYAYVVSKFNMRKTETRRKIITIRMRKYVAISV